VIAFTPTGQGPALGTPRASAALIPSCRPCHSRSNIPVSLISLNRKTTYGLKQLQGCAAIHLPAVVETKKRLYDMKLLKDFLANESGATAIEYGLIAAGISVAIITVVGTMGTNLNNTFTSVATALK
jgi:pilus assembly protein Flp/PilA